MVVWVWVCREGGAYKGPEAASRAFVDLLLDRMQVGGVCRCVGV